jgi:hypothetical protein
MGKSKERRGAVSDFLTPRPSQARAGNRRAVGLLNFNSNDPETKRLLAEAAKTWVPVPIDEKARLDATRDWFVREYLYAAPLAEILMRLVQSRGRRSVAAAMKRLPQTRLHENDRWSIWLAVQSRLTAKASADVEDACKKIARLSGVPRWLPTSERGRDGWTTATSIRSAYLRANDWVHSDESRKKAGAKLLKAHAIRRPPNTSFDAYQRVALAKLWAAARERAKRVH